MPFDFEKKDYECEYRCSVCKATIFHYYLNLYGYYILVSKLVATSYASKILSKIVNGWQNRSLKSQKR